MVEYRVLREDEIQRELFHGFIRHQNVTRCWRRVNGEWVIRDAPFIDDWTEEDYQVLVSCLRRTVATGGFVYGAFCDGVLKGFVSVEAELFGRNQEYMDLSSIHISEDMRRQGIGKRLFQVARDWAREKGRKNCIYPLIPQSRVNLFTEPWAAWRPRSISGSMWRRSRLTASWNVNSSHETERKEGGIETHGIGAR